MVGKQAQLCFHLSVLFDGLKTAVGVLMGSDKSVSHKIFVSINLSTPLMLPAIPCTLVPMMIQPLLHLPPWH